MNKLSSTPRQSKRVKRVLDAVKRLYESNPGVREFEMKKDKNGILRRAGYTFYRERWMDEILNAYRLYRGKGYR